MELLKTLSPIIVGFLGAGGLGAYFVYKGNRNKGDAEADKLHADTVVTFADGWQKYASNLENRMSEMEARYNKRIKELEDLIESRQKIYLEQIEIREKKIDDLENRIAELEKELLSYKTTEHNIDVAKEGLHESVEENLNQLKQ